jgi:hypothetical protein
MNENILFMDVGYEESSHAILTEVHTRSGQIALMLRAFCMLQSPFTQQDVYYNHNAKAGILISSSLSHTLWLLLALSRHNNTLLF